MKPIWLWNWMGGGYNWCRVDTREEALEHARKLGGETLKIDESTLRQVAYSEVDKEERQYRSLFW